MGALLTSNWAPNTAWIHGTVTEKLNTKKSIQLSRLGNRRLQAIKPAEPPWPIKPSSRPRAPQNTKPAGLLTSLPSPTSTPLLQNVITMPTQRQFVQELNQIARRGPSLSSSHREQIIGMLGGASNYYTRNGRRVWTHRLLHTQSPPQVLSQDRPRSGRPPILSNAQRKIVYRKARATPKIEHSQLAEESIFLNADGT
jgi:hypothetical protein